MRHAIAAMAGQGNNLIVDDVLLGQEKAEYAGLLSAFDVFVVGVFARWTFLRPGSAIAGID